MGGYGGLFNYTPTSTGELLVTIAAAIQVAGVANSQVAAELVYGTGAAPSSGAALVGTAIGQPSYSYNNTSAVTIVPAFFSGMLSGLALGTNYWFDLAFENQGPAGTVSLYSPSFNVIELGGTPGPIGPTGPTGPTSDSVSTGASGAFKGPGTFQMKWGSVVTTLSGVAVVFPVAFANSCAGVVISCNTGDVAGAYAGASSISTTGFTATSATATPETFFWMAVGY